MEIWIEKFERVMRGSVGVGKVIGEVSCIYFELLFWFFCIILVYCFVFVMFFFMCRFLEVVLILLYLLLVISCG